MKSKPKPYRRLPGKRRIFMGYVTLWQAKDHLLMVTSSADSEEYRRFYFSDVQAILIQKSRLHWFGVLVLALLAGLSAVDAYFERIVDDQIFLGIIAGVLILLLIVNLIRGPGCNCFIQTAVQKTKIPTLGRIRAARKFINWITPYIQQAQGELTSRQRDSLLYHTKGTDLTNEPPDPNTMSQSS